jgi:hypothetical protein
VNPLPSGEYALVYGGVMFYDFGVDANDSSLVVLLANDALRMHNSQSGSVDV